MRYPAGLSKMFSCWFLSPIFAGVYPFFDNFFLQISIQVRLLDLIWACDCRSFGICEQEGSPTFASTHQRHVRSCLRSDLPNRPMYKCWNCIGVFWCLKTGEIKSLRLFLIQLIFWVWQSWHPVPNSLETFSCIYIIYIYCALCLYFMLVIA